MEGCKGIDFLWNFSRKLLEELEFHVSSRKEMTFYREAGHVQSSLHFGIPCKILTECVRLSTNELQLSFCCQRSLRPVWFIILNDESGPKIYIQIGLFSNLFQPV